MMSRKERNRTDELIDRINNCKTMRELDSMRKEVIRAVDRGANFEKLQTAFVKKQNRLRRAGHTQSKEGYTLNDVLQEAKHE